ncbi:MAG: hypothetical protein J5764_06260 [Bacteroidales bacterium]|nr:hypothetical protein [Bacteroidales bacterium]
MKHRIILTIALIFLGGTLAYAQLTSEEYREKYQLQIRNAGFAGIGVETILDRWGRLYPDDCDMLEGRFFFWLTKARTTEVKPMARRTYMGKKPVVTLKDSLGANVNYFEVESYDDSLFSLAIKPLNKAISLKENEFHYRASLINAQMAREGENPLISVEELESLIAYDYAGKPSWSYNGEPVNADFFPGVVQEYCRLYFEIGSPASYEAMRRISEKMLKLYPSRVEFLTNMGSYWKVAKNNPKKALDCYQKALKKDTDNYVAVKNCYLLAKASGKKKDQIKYLEMLAKVSPSESEKISAAALLDGLKSAK